MREPDSLALLETLFGPAGAVVCALSKALCNLGGRVEDLRLVADRQGLAEVLAEIILEVVEEEGDDSVATSNEPDINWPDNCEIDGEMVIFAAAVRMREGPSTSVGFVTKKAVRPIREKLSEDVQVFYPTKAKHGARSFDKQRFSAVHLKIIHYRTKEDGDDAAEGALASEPASSNDTALEIPEEVPVDTPALVETHSWPNKPLCEGNELPALVAYVWNKGVGWWGYITLEALKHVRRGQKEPFVPTNVSVFLRPNGIAIEQSEHDLMERRFASTSDLEIILDRTKEDGYDADEGSETEAGWPEPIEVAGEQVVFVAKVQIRESPEETPGFITEDAAKLVSDKSGDEVPVYFPTKIHSVMSNEPHRADALKIVGKPTSPGGSTTPAPALEDANTRLYTAGKTDQASVVSDSSNAH